MNESAPKRAALPPPSVAHQVAPSNHPDNSIPFHPVPVDVAPVVRPTARPTAPGTESAHALVRTPDSDLRAANDGAHLGTTVTANDHPRLDQTPIQTPIHPTHTAPQRISQKLLLRLLGRLSDRDWQIITSIEQFRFLAAPHIQALHFPDHSTKPAAARAARRALTRLAQWRVIGTLPRDIGGMRSGSTGNVYHIDEVGDRLRRQQDPDRPRRRYQEPSTRFLSHTLAIADTVTTLIRATSSQGPSLVRYELEPASWRRYRNFNGGSVVLKPDIYLESAVSPEHDDVAAFFLEIDLGGESLTTLLRKCLAYEQYRRSGIEQDQYGAFPYVIWTMSARTPEIATRRQEALAKAISRNSQLPSELFIITTPAELPTLIMKGGAP
ncbi:replication-relaxation family protein [Rhodococcus sp. YH3-3]|uniref:replication-relaxation family protein n=1 Tax=Rhodococcus sp. YH3-3 TaxID=1803579 RepID=UPI0009EF65F4|nr:replication-relaxation family protein [Rhodococcus sp. YH3-3]